MKEKSKYYYGCRDYFSLNQRIFRRVLSALATIILFIPGTFASNFPPDRQIEIKGLVLDETTNEPLIGVNVIIDGDGAKGGAITDIEGNFKLKVPEGTVKIVFSFMGYEIRTIPFYSNNLNVFRVVTLKPASETLEEATVVAFGKQKKSSVIASITTVSPKDLKVPSSNLTTALAGRLAGVIAYQRSGEPGQDNAEFFVRGITTFGTGKADPLILIDNIELTANDLSRLNPDDIESFSILKDATATALYGARGANGVIMVTTKEGKEGKATISARYECSISAPSENVKVADPLTFMKLHNEAVRTRDPLAILPYLDSEIAARENGGNPYVYPLVDWKKMMFKKQTVNQRLNMNLSGGGKVARYYIALSYSRDNGILSVNPVNNFNNNIKLDKYLVRSNININVTKSTGLNVRVHGTFDDYQGPINGGADLYNKAIKANPVLFPATFTPDEINKYTTHVLFGNSGKNGEYMNPYAEMLRGYKEYNNTLVLAQLELKQDLDMLVKGLKARVLGNTTRTAYFDVKRHYNPFYYAIGSYDKTTDIYKLAALNPDNGTDYLSYSRDEGDRKVKSTVYLEASLSYDRTFADKHNVSGMFVYIAREELDGNANNLQNSLPKRNLGLSGRFTYAFSDRYFAEFNFGYNGSERFNKAHRWGFFPSAGIGWLVSNEDFWYDKPIGNVINKLKLKATYGLVGNDAISNDRFFYLSEVNMNNGDRGFTFGTNFTESTSGISISRYADPKIGWEVAYKLNLGTEIKFFNKLEFQIDYFRERRTKILQERADIPTTMGLQATPKSNIGEAQGHGIDLSVDYSQFFGEHWWITARGNLTYATSKFTKYEEPDYSKTTPWLSRVNQKISQARGLVAERLFVDDMEVQNSAQQQFGEYMGGDIKYKDINKDGLINGLDVVPIGFPTTPEIIYGFGASIGYKNLDFSFFFQGSARSSFWINAGAVTPFINSLEGKKGNNAVLKFIEESHWSETNQDVYAAWPRLAAYAVGNNTQTSTWFMRNGSFLRLKSAEIGYSLPVKTAHRLRMQQLRIYLSGSNLFCLSNFKLWDPEMGGNGLGYPIQRVGNIGIQLTF